MEIREVNEFAIDNMPVNSLEVDNLALSDEMNVFAGSDTETTEFAKSHKRKINLLDLLSEDFTLVLTASIATIAGMGVLEEFAVPTVAPTIAAIQMVQEENKAHFQFTITNPSNNDIEFSIENSDTEETVYTLDCTEAKSYDFLVELQYSVAYYAKIEYEDLTQVHYALHEWRFTLTEE